MSSDWSWTERGPGLVVDRTRLRTDCGLDMDMDWPWTMRGCGLIADTVAVVDWTWTRTDCGLDADTDWPWSRPSARITRGLCADYPRPLCGRKNLILLRSKACPAFSPRLIRGHKTLVCEGVTRALGKTVRFLAVCCDRRWLHPLAALRSGMTFSACLGGHTPNHFAASVSVTSCR